MKKVLFFLLTLGFTSLFAQGFNYKALLTDSNGDIVSNQAVDVKFTILNSSNTAVYVETFNVNTDANGILSVNVGEGTVVSGNFNNIDWGSDTYSLKTEIDLNDGNGYQDFGTTEFKYMPYAKSADHAAVADDVGQLTKLGVGDMPNSLETVRFRRNNPSWGEDVLDLEMNQAPSGGSAQFIECNLGSSTKFRVNHDGSVVAAGNISTNGDMSAQNISTSGDISVGGDMTIQNINASGDIAVGGEIHGSVSGDADMKAYIYGRIDSAGSKISGTCSDGFTVSKIGTGHYRITFTESGIGSNDYIVVATSWAASSPEVITFYPDNGHFDLYSWKVSDGSAQDTALQFVVYKK